MGKRGLGQKVTDHWASLAAVQTSSLKHDVHVFGWRTFLYMYKKNMAGMTGIINTWTEVWGTGSTGPVSLVLAVE